MRSWRAREGVPASRRASSRAPPVHACAARVRAATDTVGRRLTTHGPTAATGPRRQCRQTTVPCSRACGRDSINPGPSLAELAAIAATAATAHSGAFAVSSEGELRAHFRDLGGGRAAVGGGERVERAADRRALAVVEEHGHHRRARRGREPRIPRDEREEERSAVRRAKRRTGMIRRLLRRCRVAVGCVKKRTGMIPRLSAPVSRRRRRVKRRTGMIRRLSAPVSRRRRRVKRRTGMIRRLSAPVSRRRRRVKNADDSASS